jgi:hypothetical protein
LGLAATARDQNANGRWEISAKCPFHPALNMVMVVIVAMVVMATDAWTYLQVQVHENCGESYLSSPTMAQKM